MGGIRRCIAHNMSDIFGKLTPVSKGEDVRSVASAERINAIQDAIMGLWSGENIRDERGMFIQRGMGGVSIRFRRNRRYGGGEVCQLGSYGVDPDDEDKVIIVPGWLIAPNKSELIEPDPMTVTAESSVWIECPWTCLDVDGVLQSGGELGVPTVVIGTDMPDNVVPNISSLTGFAYVPLGAWDVDEKWIKAGCGSVTLDFCPGGFIIERGV
jgi:hypothetical protein